MTVHLVGAGPGDPGLLTVRGAELLRSCQAVVHDRLANPALLDLAPTTATRHDVGKRPRCAGPTQQEINDLLVRLGGEGLEVVRLKGGDPMIFGRGGEEVAALEAAGVAWSVVPGVTSAIAAPTAAGIPVTLRGASASVTIATGHEAPDGPTSVDWETMGAIGGTVVVLMATRTIGGIVDRMVAGGLDPDTPAAAVTEGTLDGQVVWRGPAHAVAAAGIAAPAVFVIGAVAGVGGRVGDGVGVGT